ncbi:hypothetical protein V6N13_001297 [Hibiscus sabdariffa]
MFSSQIDHLNESSRFTTDRPPDNLAPPVDLGLGGLAGSPSLVANDGTVDSGNVGSLRSYMGVVSNAWNEVVMASIPSLDDVTFSNREAWGDLEVYGQRLVTLESAYGPG